ncbi:MAG TPA: Gfo/Idh/MocA family oxidoreductase [Fimbriimonadaceae bacterium]|nr:Gfo/Idh/MocA family oxidoreductase [Fimbriimonadaceae bacterium]
MKKLKIAIIGTGEIANVCHLPGYRSIPEECEVVALCDTQPEVLAQASRRWEISRTTTYFRDLVDDPEIDAVSVTTPNRFHLDPTVAFLRAGKHVLCEKPLAMNAAEARQMVQAARESGKILQVALQMRFGSSGRFMRQFIDSGGMGEIYYARAHALRRRGVPHWGVFTNKELQGGGPLIDIGVHILDLTLYLMGYPKPVVASAGCWDLLAKNPKLTNFWGPYDPTKFTVEDFAVGFIRFENGACVTLESSFMANMEGDPFQTQLFGTRAGAIVKNSGDDPVRIFTEVEGQFFNMTPPHLPKVESAHTAEVQAFIRAIHNGDPSPVPGEHGWILNAIFDAMYASAESGREVAVQLD